MSDALLTQTQRDLRDQVRTFVREDVPRQLLLDMDAARVRDPRGLLERAAKRRLLGLRFDPAWGGRGRAPGCRGRHRGGRPGRGDALRERRGAVLMPPARDATVSPCE